MYATQPMQNPLSSETLKMKGSSGYAISNDQVTINIDAIANNRLADDISGTLAIELWALKQPYSGGDFSGECLAATTIGEILGQHYLPNCQYVLNFQEPGVGSWYLCLMLREWTANGYVTRDQVNFDQPYTVSWKPELVRTAADNVVSMPAAETARTDQPSEVRTEVLAPAPQTRQEVALASTRVDDKPAAKAGTRHAAGPVTGTGVTTVNLNKASVDEIAAVKNISKNLAKNIVDNRPFASFDELLEVKGIGEKLLARIKSSITL